MNQFENLKMRLESFTECVPKDANLQGTIFDTATGEVSVEQKTLVIQRDAKEFNHVEVTEKQAGNYD